VTLALFDLDHTLLDGDSELLWSQFMQAHGQVGSDFVTTMESFFADYETGTLDFVRYQAFLLSPFAHRPLHPCSTCATNTWRSTSGRACAP
jgi:phosphoserine phosphatase